MFNFLFAGSSRLKSSGAVALLAAALLAGCASSPSEPGALIADPYQETNRSIHGFNKGVDTALLKPVSEAYAIIPHPIRHVVNNELQHLRLPGIFINRVLQGDVEEASAAVGRFGINTVIGLAGLLDPATEFGLPFTPTDFGVTLAVWGVEEGIYHELPLFGPATTRDAVGRVVNFALDPAFLVTTGVVELGTALSVANTAKTPVEVVNARHQNAELIDDVFYASDDSYVTARSGYVQFRRRLVDGETDPENLPDIFE